MRARSGRGWAYLGLALGGLGSVAANLAHSYVWSGAGARPAGWTPEIGAQIASVFWPVILFVAIEIIAKSPWPAMARWAWLRYGGLSLIAVVAAVVSYLHLSGLLRHYGTGWFEQYCGPLAVDGLMIVSTGALIAARRGQPVASVASGQPVASVASGQPELDVVMASGQPWPIGQSASQIKSNTQRVASGQDVASEPATVARIRGWRSGQPDAVASVATYEDVASALEISVRTVRRYWDAAAPRLPHLDNA